MVFELLLLVLPPTGDERCDNLLVEQHERMVEEGFTLNCDPSFPAMSPYGPIIGWTDYNSSTVWIWPDEINDTTLIRLGWHELGHVLFHFPEFSEEWVDGWEWCAVRVNGPLEFDYRNKPRLKECRPYLSEGRTVDAPYRSRRK